MKRGNVVLADFPYFDRPGFKRRPVLIVQATAYNAKHATTIVAMISGQTKNAAVRHNVCCRSGTTRRFSIRTERSVNCEMQ